MGAKKRRFLILDANTLIDFCQCDKTIIKLICDYVGQVYLATPVLSEIKGIDESEFIELGIKLVEPELKQVMLVADKAADKKGPLSFQDKYMFNSSQRAWVDLCNQ